MRACTAEFLVAVACVSALPAFGQFGTPDQASPIHPDQPATFNLDAPFLVWQQQIRAGVSGQLEGVSIGAVGPPTAQITLKIRPGAASSTEPPLFESAVRKSRDGEEIIFVNMTSAGILLDAGDVFVMDTQGNGTGFVLLGSHVPQESGLPPLYPEPLFLNGSEFPPGWRHGFITFMLIGASCAADLSGDGFLNVRDFLEFLRLWAAGDDRADFDHDASINVADLLAFILAYAEGC
jgi:hypothetical protein